MNYPFAVSIFYRSMQPAYGAKSSNNIQNGLTNNNVKGSFEE
jgi:hypothetical protein